MRPCMLAKCIRIIGNELQGRIRSLEFDGIWFTCGAYMLLQFISSLCVLVQINQFVKMSNKGASTVKSADLLKKSVRFSWPSLLFNQGTYFLFGLDSCFVWVVRNTAYVYLLLIYKIFIRQTLVIFILIASLWRDFLQGIPEIMDCAVQWILCLLNVVLLKLRIF